MLPRPKRREQVGQTMAQVFLGSPEERGYLGSPEEFRAGYLGSPEETPPVLTFGSSGRWVVFLQQKLGLVPTGVFDVGTQAAVRNFQLRVRLAPTGVVDFSTWAALGAVTGLGSNVLVPPYSTYAPYSGSYYGYPTYYGYPFFTFHNASRGGGSSSSGGGR